MVELRPVGRVVVKGPTVDPIPAVRLGPEGFWKFGEMIVHIAENELKPNFSSAEGAHN